MGIGVGVGIGGLLFLLALAAIFFLLKRYQKKKLALANMEIQDKPELQGCAIPQHKAMEELNGQPVHEMEDTGRAVEIGG